MPHQQQISPSQNNKTDTGDSSAAAAAATNAAAAALLQQQNNAALAAFFPTEHLLQPFPTLGAGQFGANVGANTDLATAAAFGILPNTTALYHPNALVDWQAQAAAAASLQAQVNAANNSILNPKVENEKTHPDGEKKDKSFKGADASKEKHHRSKKVKKGSESDEEAAATALLMAGGTASSRRSAENVESMQAAVRNKKKLLMNKVKEIKERERERDRREKKSSSSVNGGGGSSSSNREKESREAREIRKLKELKELKERQRRSSEREREVRRGESISSSSARDKLSHRQNSGLSDGSGGSGSGLVLNNFTNVLHDVLSKSEFAGTALEWMSHGKSWRVLRWDELAESVIPAYFPELCVSSSRSGSGGSSSRDRKRSTITDRMNMFIRQIKVWGFKEVREVGPDLGSFHHEFFMKIAPNLCRHMKLITKKGTKRTAENANIVSPPRKSQRSHHMAPAQPNHANHHPGYHPGFMNPSEVFKKKPSRSSASSGTDSPPKRHMYSENREDLTSDDPSPDRAGPRCVSFQERLDGEESSPPGNRHQQYESPRSHPDIALNFVSLSGQTESGKHGHHVSVRSNRGGSRSSRGVERDETSSKSSRSGFSVSNRGRGHRHISSRGRSSKSGSVRPDKERDHQQTVHDDEPLIIKSHVEKTERPVETEPKTITS